MECREPGAECFGEETGVKKGFLRFFGIVRGSENVLDEFHRHGLRLNFGVVRAPLPGGVAYSLHGEGGKVKAEKKT